MRPDERIGPLGASPSGQAGDRPVESAPPLEPLPARPDLPTIWLVGDSTVRVATPGQVGWGDVIGAYFDPARINVVNRAMAGRSSRTFLTEGLWEDVRRQLRAGDFVLLQFGHNDAGPTNDNHRARGTLPGVGNEAETIDNLITGETETVSSFGHYLRRYVEETRAAGANPVLCSLVPRKLWSGKRIQRDEHTHAGWTAEVARTTGTALVDLNSIIARRYEILGPERVDAFFADEDTHTTRAGAVCNAQCVIAGLRDLPGDPFGSYLSAAGRTLPDDP